jgi:GMP synthase (glutamine-hydrolysing)
MMCRWTIRGAERLTRPGAQGRPAHLGGWYQHDGQVAAWLEAFLPAWIEGRLGKSTEPLRPAVKRPKPVETPRRLTSMHPQPSAGERPSLAELVS